MIVKYESMLSSAFARSTASCSRSFDPEARADDAALRPSLSSCRRRRRQRSQSPALRRERRAKRPGGTSLGNSPSPFEGTTGYDSNPMRILYGVVGEGMGHATRSKVV